MLRPYRSDRRSPPGPLATQTAAPAHLRAVRAASIVAAVFSTCLAAPASFASEAADAVAAAKSFYSDMDNKDLSGISRLIPADGFTELGPDSPELHRLDREAFPGLFKSGMQIELRATDVQAQVFGNTAIVTGLRAGSITKPGATPAATANPFTMIWLNSNGHWQLHHIHLSAPAGSKSPE